MNQETAAPESQLGSRVPNFSVRLSPTPRGARLARLLAEPQLRMWELPWEKAAHIVAELAANAATHGRVPGRDFQLLLYVVAGTLRIEVTDTRGDRLPETRQPVPDGESGRGLPLVEALADRWGVSSGRPPCKTVWAEITLPAPEPGCPCPGTTALLAGETERSREDSMSTHADHGHEPVPRPERTPVARRGAPARTKG